MNIIMKVYLQEPTLMGTLSVLLGTATPAEAAGLCPGIIEGRRGSSSVGTTISLMFVRWTDGGPERAEVTLAAGLCPGIKEGRGGSSSVRATIPLVGGSAPLESGGSHFAILIKPVVSLTLAPSAT